MKVLARWMAPGSLLAGLAVLSGSALGAGPDLGQAQMQATNWTAISMFGLFVVGTLFITKWAAARTRSVSDFYTAGGGITGYRHAKGCCMPRTVSNS